MEINPFLSGSKPENRSFSVPELFETQWRTVDKKL